MTKNPVNGGVWSWGIVGPTEGIRFSVTYATRKLAERDRDEWYRVFEKNAHPENPHPIFVPLQEVPGLASKLDVIIHWQNNKDCSYISLNEAGKYWFKNNAKRTKHTRQINFEEYLLLLGYFEGKTIFDVTGYWVPMLGETYTPAAFSIGERDVLMVSPGELVKGDSAVEPPKANFFWSLKDTSNLVSGGDEEILARFFAEDHFWSLFQSDRTFDLMMLVQDDRTFTVVNKERKPHTDPQDLAGLRDYVALHVFIDESYEEALRQFPRNLSEGSSWGFGHPTGEKTRGELDHGKSVEVLYGSMMDRLKEFEDGKYLTLLMKLMKDHGAFDEALKLRKEMRI